MLEPTHIINPTQDRHIPVEVQSVSEGYYVSTDSPVYLLEDLNGQVLPTEAQAVSQWNAMFSKAPYVAHTGEVDMWPEKHNG